MRIQFLGGVALCALFAAPAFAQSNAAAVAETGAPAPAATPADPADTGDEIVITGIRSSLRSSLATKRNADLIVDSISAEDTGKFPDNNIAESLQRITGVAIDRSGGEGQFITVRGLGPEFNTVLVNGRIMATDNDGREFSFDVLSSNLIQRTDVYKSSMPQLQEGGIGATVNVITAKPLDGKAGLHVSVAGGGIYDKLADKLSPDLSSVVSLTNQDKTLGIVVSASYTDRRSERDFADTNGWILGPEGLINGTPGSTGLTGSALVNSPSNIHTPRNLSFYREANRRERLNLGTAVQAKLGDRLLLTVDGLYSQFNVTQNYNAFGQFYTPSFIGLTTDANGTVTSFNRPGSQFLAANPALTDPALADRRVTLAQNDNIVQNSLRKSESYQIGANVKWDATDDLTLRFDASKTQATRKAPRQFVVVGSLAQTSPSFEINKGGDMPIGGNFGPITDASLMRAHFSLNEMIRVKDKGSEYHADGEFRADRGILKSLTFGTAYNERRKTRNVANNSDASCSYCGYAIPVPGNLLTTFTLDNFLSKGSGSDRAPEAFFAFDPQEIFAYLSQPSVLALPQQGRTAAQQAVEAARVLALPGGPFGLRDQPVQRLDVQEKVWAAYVNANFEGDGWSGNVGARFIDTRVVSRGFAVPVVNVTTQSGDDNLNFTYGTPVATSVSNHYMNLLPSANLKYELTSRMFLRAAASQTLTRPTLTSLGVDNSYGGRITVPTSSGGNPNLKPFRSTNYDLSYEWYVTDVSFVSLSGFYKKFEDFLETQTLPVDFFGFTFQDTRTRNGQSGSIAGVEVGGQYSFDRLPGALSGFGVAGNYTYVTSSVSRATDASNAQCGYNGLSPHSANGSVFYEKYGIQARASYNWRSSFLRACFGQASRPESRESYGQVDASISYNLTPQLQVYAQGVNLTNSYVRDYSVLKERFLLLQSTGPRYLFGVRASF